MSGFLDKIGDLIHNAYDPSSGASTPSAPSKPAATIQDASHHLGTGVAQKGADLVSGRQAQIDQAVKDAGG